MRDLFDPKALPGPLLFVMYSTPLSTLTSPCSLNQWRSQDLEVGAQRVWGTEVPQRGPGAKPLVGGSGGHSLPKDHSSYLDA